MIYDCFTFFEEWEVLRIRLEELHDVVDRFVLVEASHTFRGKSRDAEYWVKRDRIPYELRRNVTAILVSEPLPEDPWQAEAYVRNAILRGLTRAKADDLVLISDVDEIPRASLVASLIPDEPLSLVPRAFYFTLDWEVPVQAWHHYPVFLRYADLTTPQDARLNGGRTVSDAGWHFSCLGSPQRLARKLHSFAHSECDRPEIVNVEHIAECMTTGRDVLGRFDLLPVEVDESYPQYVREHLNEFSRLLRPR